jgi:pimeloyl-ACP methyl ester carboxylesterase
VDTDAQVLSPSVEAWRRRGMFVDIAGHRLFVVDTGPAEERSAVVLLHGFPASSYDWRAVVAGLSGGRRVVTLDFVGFGMSHKPSAWSYSLIEQAELVEQLLRLRGVARVDLVAHDMGTSVACELLARRRAGLLSFELASLTLTNGSVYIEMSHLTPSQQLLRLPGLGRVFASLSRYGTFRAQVRRLFGSTFRRGPEAAVEEEIRAMFDLIAHGGGKARLHQTIRYIEERWRYGERWTGPLRELSVPVMVLWGVEDPVAVMDIGERLGREIPGARLERLDGVGHFPAIEAPDRVLEKLEQFLSYGSARLGAPSENA